MKQFRKFIALILTVLLFFLNCKEESNKKSDNSDSEFEVEIEKTLSALINQEDTDGDKKITIDDQDAPKKFELIDQEGNRHVIEGTFELSNLMEELVIARNNGKQTVNIDLKKIDEKPADRTSRLIKDFYWDGLTRHLDKNGIEQLVSDTKNKSLVSEELKIYVPYNDSIGYGYFKNLENDLPISVIKLPKDITPEYVKSINKEAGILSLKLAEVDGQLKGVPFVVPGGRFNEMYGWDSYFESIGLLIDGRVDLAKAMADNFQYEIEHYGKILNANRSYYLTRSQPPYYSSLIRSVFEKTGDKNWLRSHLETAIKEYESVWMEKGARLTDNGLNRYYSNGIGIPPETEEGHFKEALESYAKKYNLTAEEFTERYQSRKLKSEEVDMYFTHDRSMRESGHDTSYRLEGKTADLNVVDVNALLYKYETDFADLIETEFAGEFKLENGNNYTEDFWRNLAEARKEKVNKFLWNDQKGLYLDYNLKENKQEPFIAATTFMPMWTGMASKEQAQALVENALPLLKEKGGVAASTKESIGTSGNQRPQRQWDYPNGWAPHQMMIWKGLLDYGYDKEAQELIYRWLYMITENAVNYNGTIPEKYNVVEATHKVFAEYGNVGTDFEYITKEGFGWMNASFQYGMSLLDEEAKENLNNLVDPDKLYQNFKK